MMIATLYGREAAVQRLGGLSLLTMVEGTATDYARWDWMDQEESLKNVSRKHH